jgi:hypothetical protein
LKKWELKVVDVAERYADGLATPEEFQEAHERSTGKSGVAWVATLTADFYTAVEAARFAGEYRDEEFQCVLVREIFGNPFHKVKVEPDWLVWKSSSVPRLAQAIYDDRAFERLPILADALEEAGCADAAILAHCRGPGPHVRGCWVVDLLLGKA